MLWDYHTHESWAHRLDRFKSRAGLGKEKVLVVGDLDKATGDAAVREAVATWCEEVDDLGMLVWMVNVLE